MIEVTKSVFWGAAQGVGFYLGIFVMKRLRSLSLPEGISTDGHSWTAMIKYIWSIKMTNDAKDDSNNSFRKNDKKRPRRIKKYEKPSPSGGIVKNELVQNEMNSRTRVPSRSESMETETDAGRYLEMLIHNVAHADLVLSLGSAAQEKEPVTANVADHAANSSQPPLILCRPRFSAFDLFSRRIFTHLTSSSSSSSSSLSSQRDPPAVISFPRYERNDATPRYNLVTPRPSRQMMLPVGMALPHEEESVSLVTKEELSSHLRVRGRDVDKLQDLTGLATEDDKLRFNAVFFPLLAALIPQWERSITESFSCSASSLNGKGANVKKVVVLVSGVGTPRNYTHSLTGNSTEAVALLMEYYLKLLYPDITVVRLHSHTNIFRYDENISFVNRELLPCIDAYRDAHARKAPYPDEQTNTSSLVLPGDNFDPEWKKTFRITLSFADGSPARTHAIQSGLRSYRPVYFHVWQLKTFWHDTKISDDDVEVHSFEDMETVPAIDASAVTSWRYRAVIDDMIAFKEQFLSTFQRGCHDLDSFWLRKTRKPVLAVLLVETPQGEVRVYRGTNMEVSMPTGSLCAERNVIGTALASDVGLKRGDLKMIAVLAVSLPPPSPSQLPQHCVVVPKGGVGEEGILKTLSTDRLERDSVTRSLSVTSCATNEVPDDEENSVISWINYHDDSSYSSHSPQKRKSATQGLVPPLLLQSTVLDPSGTPVRRISLYSNRNNLNTDDMWGCCKESARNKNTTKAENTTKQKAKQVAHCGCRRAKKTVVVHSPEDINPLAPCGACNEWLKKIAELNPYFKVLTFTDANCNGVYVNSCQD